MAFKNYGTKKEGKIKYEVIEKFGVLDSDSKVPKELRLVSWNGGDPKYDLRNWTTDDDGNEVPGKGLTLSCEELTGLFEILKRMDEEEEE